MVAAAHRRQTRPHLRSQLNRHGDVAGTRGCTFILAAQVHPAPSSLTPIPSPPAGAEPERREPRGVTGCRPRSPAKTAAPRNCARQRGRTDPSPVAKPSASASTAASSAPPSTAAAVPRRPSPVRVLVTTGSRPSGREQRLPRRGRRRVNRRVRRRGDSSVARPDKDGARSRGRPRAVLLSPMSPTHASPSPAGARTSTSTGGGDQRQTRP